MREMENLVFHLTHCRAASYIISNIVKGECSAKDGKLCFSSYSLPSRLLYYFKYSERRVRCVILKTLFFISRIAVRHPIIYNLLKDKLYDVRTCGMN